MPGASRPSQAPLRLVEVFGSISMATDVATGQPIGHGLRVCRLATALAEVLGSDDEEVRTVHHAALLRFLGCTSDAAETAVAVGGDDVGFNAAMAPALNGTRREVLGRLLNTVAANERPARRARLIAGMMTDPRSAERSLSTHCEVGALLARGLHVGDAVGDALAPAYERWDGKGYPGHLQGDAIPLAVRIFVVARDVELSMRGGEDTRALLDRRRGRAYDPAVVDAFAAVGQDVLDAMADDDEWVAVLDWHPRFNSSPRFQPQLVVPYP